ncbi:citryl-CoA lyase [Sphingobium sp. MI1205]|nr:citryl-CoA lyase [Sphingobium sp. MI1205]
MRPDGFRRVVDALAANPGAGVLVLDGKMIDRPHRKKCPALLTRR